MDKRTEGLGRQVLESIQAKLGKDFDLLPRENIYTKFEIEVPQEVMEFCRLIEKVGGRALLVGGCVRDAVMSQESGRGKVHPKDMDLEVYGVEPNDLLVLVDMHFGLEKAGTFGKQFEVIKIFGRGRTYDLDISIPREDNKTGTGSKGFETSSHPEYSIKEAAKRRDLTCNSLAHDPIQHITYDPYSGIEDIRNNKLRATDQEKFAEDPVRILRIMQFVARFGATVDPKTEELCKRMILGVEEMKGIKYHNIIVGGTEEETGKSLQLIDRSPIELDNESRNRIYEEFKKMLIKGRVPSAGLEFARIVGIIDRYFPWLAELIITQQETEWHPEGNVWNHTLQVLDAAAEIAVREGLNDEDHLTLMLSALSHDSGKPTKTRIKEKQDGDGKPVRVIGSDGHDMEGGWLSDEMLNLFAPERQIHWDESGEYAGWQETYFATEMRRKVKVLTEEHMRPKFIYDEFKKGIDTKKMLGRLARRLGSVGVSVRLLCLLAEADQRGRNGENNIPLKRDQVKELEDWQGWVLARSQTLQMVEKMPEKILTGETVIRSLELKPGPIVGVLVEWVFDDQLSGEISSVEQGLEMARMYLRIIKEALVTVESQGLFIRDKHLTVKYKHPEDEVLVWMKQEGVKDQVLAISDSKRLDK